MADNPTFTTTVATLPSGTVAGLMQEATTGALVPRGVSVFQTGGSTGAWTFTLAASGAGAVTGGTQRITLASDDPAVAAIGAKADSSATTDTGTFSLIALFKRLLEKVTAQLPAALTGSGNLKTAVQEALPAGSNAIGGVTQSGTWTVQPGNTANTTAWLVTGTGGTFPVTDNGGSLTVDNGGTFVVQENGAALAALQSLASAVLTEDAAHSSGDKGIMPLAVRKDSGGALAGADGDYIPLQTDANGYLRVNVAAGGASGGTSSTDDAAFTAASGSGTPMMGFVTSDSVDAGDVGVVGMLANRQLKVTLFDSAGSELSVGGGTQYTEDAAAAANPVGNALIVVRDDARGGSLTSADGDNIALRGTNAGELYVKHVDAVAVNPISGQAGVAAGAGTVGATTQRVTLASDDPVVVAIQILDNIVSGNEAQVDVVTLPEVPPAASATVTGCTPFFDSDGDNTAQTIKGSSGRLYFLEVSNPNTADAYLQLFDESGAITVGTTTPKLSFLVPAGDGTNDGAFDRVFVVPIEFVNSIKYACTTTATGNTDPTTGLIVNAGYR